MTDETRPSTDADAPPITGSGPACAADPSRRWIPCWLPRLAAFLLVPISAWLAYGLILVDGPPPGGGTDRAVFGLWGAIVMLALPIFVAWSAGAPSDASQPWRSELRAIRRVGFMLAGLIGIAVLTALITWRDGLPPADLLGRAAAVWGVWGLLFFTIARLLRSAGAPRVWLPILAGGASAAWFTHVVWLDPWLHGLPPADLPGGIGMLVHTSPWLTWSEFVMGYEFFQSGQMYQATNGQPLSLIADYQGVVETWPSLATMIRNALILAAATYAAAIGVGRMRSRFTRRRQPASDE